MQTRHEINFSNAQDMEELDDDTVELMVTSPPYPMIEMWDDMFSDMNKEINECLSDENSDTAFDLMHQELAQVWEEVQRVLCPGGIACINIGDATRKIGETFQLFPNHVRTTEQMQDLGFTVLPSILWRKPTNKASKFMGSGMLPPNAYVTLEHEYILIFRNGSESRSFEPHSDRRYRSAYFWEERNQWYSDLWTDIAGKQQGLLDSETRERSAAFPFIVPYRLINMFSVQGDTVLDPFWGTGTTSLASMASARNSVGYELDDGFKSVFEDRADHVAEQTVETNRERMERHHTFITNQETDTAYTSSQYNTSVKTQQEEQIQLWDIANIVQEQNVFTVEHTPFEKEEKKTEEGKPSLR